MSFRWFSHLYWLIRCEGIGLQCRNQRSICRSLFYHVLLSGLRYTGAKYSRRLLCWGNVSPQRQQHGWSSYWWSKFRPSQSTQTFRRSWLQAHIQGQPWNQRIPLRKMDSESSNITGQLPSTRISSRYLYLALLQPAGWFSLFCRVGLIIFKHYANYMYLW